MKPQDINMDAKQQRLSTVVETRGTKGAWVNTRRGLRQER